MTQIRPSRLEINLTALRENFRTIKSCMESPFLCPMVKANAYGHGVVPVVNALIEEGANRFGLATFEEAVDLRESGIDEPELIIISRVSELAISAIDKFNLIPIVSTFEEVDLLDQFIQTQRRLSVHIMLDLGMNRLGIKPESFERLLRKVQNSKRLKLAGVGTHFSHSEDVFSHESITKKRLSEFRQLTSELGPEIFLHCFNSQGFLGEYLNSGSVSEGVRPGISLFGVKQGFKNCNDHHRESFERLKIRPVMSLLTRVAHVQRVKIGETISYSGTWTAPKDSIVGVLPIGYADGVRRSLSNNGFVYILGQKAPLIGTVCMDYSFIDLTHIMGHKVNDFLNQNVLFFGQNENSELPIETVAKWQGTIPYEVMTNMGTRLPRTYKDR